MQAASLDSLRAALQARGAALQEDPAAGYLLAAVPSLGGFSRDLCEFLFSDDDDTTVSLRALPGTPAWIGKPAARRFLEDLRIELGWDLVVVLRGRTRALGVIESPFDKFGDAAPLGVDWGEVGAEAR